MARPARLAMETIILVSATLAMAIALGIPLALLLFRTDVAGRGLMLALLGVAAFVPLPLHATAWLGALGNAGRLQALGARPILVGRTGAAVVHGLAALPWFVLIVGAGLCAVEPELEESALLDYSPAGVWLRVTLRRAWGAILAAALAVAVLTAGDMTVTDLLQIRTYAEEAYLQYSLGNGPGAAAVVALPPLVVLGVLIAIAARALARLDPREWLRRLLGREFGGSAAGGFLPAPAAGRDRERDRTAALQFAVARGQSRGPSDAGTTSDVVAVGIDGNLGVRSRRDLGAVAGKRSLDRHRRHDHGRHRLRCSHGLRGSTAWRSVAIATLALTLAAPGPVAGMALVLAYRALPAVYDSPAMIVMAETMRTLPYSLLLLWPFLHAFPQEYLDAAALDGRGPCGQMIHVVLPLSRRPLLAAWALAFALGLGELPATNLVAPPGTEPMSVLIWGLLHTGVESHLAGVALIMLMVVAGAGLFAAMAVRSLRTLDRPVPNGA